LTKLARWLSILLHPFVTTAVMIGGCAVALGAPGEAARSIVIVALSAVLPIAVLMVLQVRRGAWQNVDASNVRERPVLYAVAGAGLLLLVTYLVVARPQSFLLRGAVGTLAMVAVCGAATRWVKVSLHLAFAALASTTLLIVGSPAGWVLAVLLPALAWSRLTLGRHRPVEVVLGIAIGVVTGLAIIHV
jgi:membrane-associated phospholipid phosphatase